MLKLFFALALLPLGLDATPTRALTLDNQQMIIADDYDATIYYHLAPNFKNHFYADLLNGGKERGWAFVDLKVGTLAIWLNKDYGAKPLFDGVDAGGRLGYQHLDLASNTGNAHAPLESWIRDPQMKLAGGFAYELSENINAALCVQWAGLEQKRDYSGADGSGAALLGGGTSLTRYLSGSYASNLTVTAYKNTQASSGLALAPSIGINTQRFAVDLKFETISNGINNIHEEKVADGAGTMSGTVTQGLKDKGAGSWLTMGKFRMPFKSGSLVLRGGYFNYDFSTQHTQKGAFSGTGFGSAAELAGFDHVDAEENFTVKSWDSMVGWTMNSDNSKGMVVFGLGANASSLRREDFVYAPRSGGSGFNDLVKSSRDEYLLDTFAVPLLMGAELELSKFAKCSGSASHNLSSSSAGKATSESYDASTGALATQTVRQDNSDAANAWKFNAGLGLYFGSFSWDFALNNAFLASSGGWVNPAYQSTLSWGY